MTQTQKMNVDTLLGTLRTVGVGVITAIAVAYYAEFRTMADMTRDHDIELKQNKELFNDHVARERQEFLDQEQRLRKLEINQSNGTN
jgi:hypothetical protein